MKQELLVMANQAAVLRGELNGVAAENVRLLGLTGSPECPPGGAAAMEGRRAAGPSGCAKDEEGPERREVTMGAEVMSPKREGGENPSPLCVDKDTEAAADAAISRSTSRPQAFDICTQLFDVCVHGLVCTHTCARAACMCAA